MDIYPVYLMRTLFKLMVNDIMYDIWENSRVEITNYGLNEFLPDQ